MIVMQFLRSHTCLPRIFFRIWEISLQESCKTPSQFPQLSKRFPKNRLSIFLGFQNSRFRILSILNCSVPKNSDAVIFVSSFFAWRLNQKNTSADTNKEFCKEPLKKARSANRIKCAARTLMPSAQCHEYPCPICDAPGGDRAEGDSDGL